MDGAEKDRQQIPLQIDLNAVDLDNLIRQEKDTKIAGLNLNPEDLKAIRLVSSAQTGSQVIRDEEFNAMVNNARRHLQKRGLQVDLVTLYTPNLDLSDLIKQLQAKEVSHNVTARGIEVFGPHAKIHLLKTVQKKDIPSTIQPIRQEFTRIKVKSPKDK